MTTESKLRERIWGSKYSFLLHIITDAAFSNLCKLLPSLLSDERLFAVLQHLDENRGKDKAYIWGEDVVALQSSLAQMV